MKCCGCGHDSIIVWVETFLCVHCKKELELEYNVCKECGMTWKTVGGELFSKPTFLNAGLGKNFCEGGEVMPDIKQMHRCLRCQIVSSEIKENLYRCPECGFEWEVLKSGQ